MRLEIAPEVLPFPFRPGRMKPPIGHLLGYRGSLMDLFPTLGFVVLAAGASVAITTLWLRRRENQAEAALAAAEAHLETAQHDRDAAVEARVVAERGAASAQAELAAIQVRLED